MKKLLCILILAYSVTGAMAQNTIRISGGTKLGLNGNVQVGVGGGNLVNNGIVGGAGNGKLVFAGSVSYSGTGTAQVPYFTVSNTSGISVLNAPVSVTNTASLLNGSQQLNNHNLIIRSDLSTSANLVISGTPSGTVDGLITMATVATGACTSFTTTLSVNISGPTVNYQWQSSPDSLSWSDVSGAVAPGYIATISSTIYYRCHVTVTGSSFDQATAPVKITLGAAVTPIVTANGPTAFCSGGQVILTASAGSSYLWSNNATTQSITVNATGNYSVKVTDANGCSATSVATTVTVNTVPVMTVSASSAICTGGSATLTATGAQTYLWQPGSLTESSITVSPTVTTSYTVTGTNVGTCSSIPGDNWKAVAVGGAGYTLALKTDGTLWGTGNNSSGQFGDGTTTTSTTFRQVSAATWTAITARVVVSYGIKTGGSLWAWGSNSTGQLGNGTNTSSIIPVQVGSATWLKVAAGSGFALGIQADGTLWAWGDNTFGQLGNGTTTSTNSPVQIGSGTWTSVSAGDDFSYGIKSNGTLWAWGHNNFYQLGLGNSTAVFSSPQQVGTATWLTTTGGQSFGLGIQTNGTLWGWGYGSTSTALGLGTTISFPVPTQVGTSTWLKISAYYRHTIGIKTDGSLWAWGDNSSGQSGYGSTTDSNIPVLVDNNQWTDISAYQNFSMGLRANGALMGTGVNTSAQIGNGTTTSVTSFVQTPGVIITVNTLPTVSAITGTMAVCVNATTKLNDVTTGGVWSSDNTTVATVSNTGLVTGLQSGTAVISYSVTNANNCTTIVTATVTVNALPTATITAGSTTTFCAGGSVVLTASAGSSYLWSNNATTQSITVNAAGNYGVTVKNAANCSATSAATIVTVNALPTISGAFATCAPTSRPLTGSGTPAVSSPWVSSNTSIVTVNNTGVETAVAAAGGSAVITYTDANGCSATATIIVPALPPTPTISVVNNCDGTSALTASGSPGYQWTAGAGVIATTASITVNTAGTYNVRGANASCVSGFASATAAPHTAPLAPAGGGNQSRCGNGNVTLSATPGSGEVTDWYSVATGGTLLQSNSNTYIVSATTTVYAEARNTTTGCVSATRTAVTATINSVVTPNFTQVAAICSGAILSALPTTSTNGITGAWSPALNNTATTTYTFTPSVGMCASTTTMTITVNPLPTATISAGSATTFCSGGQVILTASAGSSYLWSNGATTQSITVNATGNYSVTVTNANNCSATSAATTVTVNALPSSKTTQVGTNTFCAGGSTVLTASATGSYLWSNSATTQSITVTASGNYSVTVTDANNCSVTSSPYAIVVNPSPTATITAGGATTFCAGGSVILTASAGSAYLWSDNETTQSITVNATGNYSVTVKNANGCSATSAVTSVTVNTLPVITTNSNSPVMAYGILNLSASGADSYIWSGPNSYSANTSSASVTNISSANAGVYIVTGQTTATGCTNSASVNVVVNFIPATGLNFDGVDDYVSLNNPTVSNLNTFTLEAWVKPTATSGTIYSEGLTSSLNPMFSLIHTPNGSNGFEIVLRNTSNVGLVVGTTTGNLVMNQWSHVAFVRTSATTAQLFINGTLTDNFTFADPGTIAVNVANLGVRQRSNKEYYFTGSMDEVRIWNRALCQAEIQNNRDCELNAVGQTGLLSLYHFNQGLAGGDNTPVVTVTAPGAPTINSVTAGNGSVTVNFTAPSSNGGSPVTSYSVTSTPGGAVQSGTGSPIIFSGLTNGTPYTFTITATNVAGTSAPSASSGSTIPVGVPSAPSITNVVSGNAQVTVNFIAPSSNGGSSILDYTVTSTPGGFTKTGSASPLIVSGLTNGQSYIFTVKARNANGFGASSPASSSIIPATVPAVGQILSVTGGDASAIVSFSLTTSDGGSHITKYVITANPGGLSQNANTSPYTFTGLTNGNFYTFTVKAVNALGISLPSAASNPPTLIRSLAKRVMIEYNNALGADIDVSTGWALAADQSEYEPFTYEPMLAAPAIPYTVIRPNIVNNQNYILTYDTSDNLYIGQDYLSFFPGDFNEFFNSNGDPTPIDIDITGVFLITTDLYLVDAQTQTQLYDPVTLQGIAFTDDFQVLPTPYSLQPSYAAAHNLQAQTKRLSIPPTANGYVMVNPKTPVDSKTGVVITNATAPAENTVKAATISANGNPLYITGPYSYGNATAADQIELSGNISVDDLNHTIGLLTVTDAAPSNNITVTNKLIDETGNNNGVLSNFALTGNTSNWTTGIAAGTCAPFVAPTTPITGTNTVCVGSTTVLSNTTAGGVWSSSNNAVAIVDAGGIVKGVSAGTGIISYTNNCGGISTATVTVSALPVATISTTDATTACPGSTVRLQANTGSGLTYQWQNNGADIRGATASGYAATVNGTYAVVITNGNNCVSPVSNSITVTLQDITAPVAPVLPDVTAQCSATVSAPTATDACSGIVTGTTTDSVNYHTQGSFVIHWKFTDGSNNSSFADQHVFIRDVTPPVIVCQPDITVTAASALGAVVNYTEPVGTDNCSSTTTRTAGLASGSTFPIGTTRVTYTVTDVAGLTANCSFNVIVAGLAPSINCPVDITVSNATDQCGNRVDFAATERTGMPASTIIYSIAPGSFFGIGTTAVTATATNAVGSSSCTFNVTVTDDQHPVFDAITNISVNTDSGKCGASINISTPTATDNCRIPAVTGVRSDGLLLTDDYPTGTTVITWTATDVNNNTTTATQNITVKDNEAPVPDVATLATITGECSVGVTVPTAMDNCAGKIRGRTSDPTSYKEQGTYTIMWSYDDGNGNISTQTQTVIIADTTAPVPDQVTLPTVTGECSVTINATAASTVPKPDPKPAAGPEPKAAASAEPPAKPSGPVGTPVPGSGGVRVDPPTATDNCTGRVTATTTDPLTYTIQGSYIIHWIYDDGHGNTSAQEQIVIVKDVTAPVADNKTLETVTGECTATVTGAPTATDNCAGTITGTTTDSLTYSTQGTYTVTWSFDDRNGNVSTQTQTVIVKDTKAPVADNDTLTTVTGECTATVTDAPTATDNCAGTVTGITADPLTYSRQGTYMITWSFDDHNGNVSTQTQTVIVKDTTAPVVPILTTVTGECSATATVPTATDNCVGIVTGTTSDSLTYNTQGTYTIHWTFDDGNGNTSTATQTVIVKDITPPMIICPDNISVFATSAAGAVVNYTAPVGTDNCSGVTTLRTVGLASGSTFPIGTTTVTHTVTDIAGLTAQCSFTVTVAGLAPVINCPSNIIVTNATDQCGANVSFAATETTAIPASVITYSVAPGSFFAIGTTTVVVTATNAVSSSTCRFTVTVTDNQFPVLTGVPANRTVECSAIPAAAVVTATDNCSTSVPSYKETRTDGNCPNNYTLTRTWSTTDASGNTTTASQVITVVDHTAPVLSVAPVNVTVECNAVPVAAVLTATDNCGTASVAMVETRVNGNCINNYTLTRTWTATDLCGNTSSVSQTITVSDHTAPVLSAAPANTTVECDAVPTAAVLTATDNCGAATVTMVETRTNGNYPRNYTLTRVWTATDLCGNTSSTKTQVITVQDTKAPVPVIASLPILSGDCSVTAIAPTANDNCAGTVTATTVNPVTYTAQGVYTITWNYNDGNGNTTTQLQRIVVKDVNPPVPNLTMLPTVTGQCSATVTSKPTATDLCAGLLTGTTTDPLTYTAQGTFTIHWTYTDSYNNKTVQLQTVIVKDNIAPVVNAVILPTVTGQCSASIVITNAGRCTDNCACCRDFCRCRQGSNCNCHRNDGWNYSNWWNNLFGDDNDGCDFDGNSDAYYMSAPTATDNCKGTITGTTTDPLTYSTQGTYTIHWNFNDGNGNITVQTQQVVVQDNQAPIVWQSQLPILYGQCSVNLSSYSNDWSWWDDDDDDNGYGFTAPWAWDNCAGWIQATTVDPTSYTSQGTYTIHWAFNDGHGNITTQNQTVIVKDNVAPRATVNNLPTLKGACSVTVTTRPTANDNCAGIITATTTDPLTYTAQGNYIIHWTYNDGHGNTSTQNQSVSVDDDTAPVATVSSLPTVSGNCSVTVTTVPTANDNCKGIINGTTTDPLTYNAKGSYTIHWTFNDGNGNVTTQNQTVTVIDATPPVPQVATLPTITGSCNVTVTAIPKANDVCGGVITATTTSPLTYNARGTYTITWKYSDGNGNTSTQTQTVNVVDITAPVITVPNNTTINCGGSSNPSATGNATATDNCSGVVSITYSDVTNGNTITRTWKATDAAGNISTGVQTITSVDNTKPVITDPKDVTVSCGTSRLPSATGTATATDNCSTPTVTYADNTNGNVITRTWTATDAAGNTSSSTQIITIVDNTKPTITDPADVTVNCGASTDPSVTGIATGTDNCSSVTITHTDVTSGNTITRTWRATDASGNYATSTQTITIGSAFSASVTSVPTNSTYTGSVSTNLYIGYGAQSTTLTMCSLPSAGAPYTYNWSGAYTNMLNSTTTASPVFTPTTFGYYTFNVTVTNKYGCTSTSSISICVTDIRVPGTSGANLKVYVCHTPTGKNAVAQTLQVLISQVPSHIGNNTCGGNGNDRLGSCDQSPCNITITNSTNNVVTATKDGGTSEVSTSEDELKVTVMPNPTTTFFTLKLESKYETPVNMRVMDARGRVIDARSKIGANSTIQIGHNYSSGTYYAELMQGNVRKVVQMIKGRG